MPREPGRRYPDSGAPTARCLILVTPEGQRTINTFLGACVTFGKADVDTSLVGDAR
jgi:sugar/nucleoside kinase (ribokinase family)